MNVFDGFCQSGVCCGYVISLGFDECGLGGKGDFKFVYPAREAVFPSPLGDLKFFQLAGLQGIGFLKAGNLFLKGGNLGSIFVNS